MYRNIMIGVDNSAHSHLAVDQAIAIARATGARLTGNHVYAAGLHDSRFRELEPGLPERYRREEMLHRLRHVHDDLIGRGLGIISDSYLDLFEEKCHQVGVPAERKAMEGRNYAELLRDARESGYDLVAVGAHGLGKVDRAVLGSVCERVARLADCDVLVVREARALNDGPLVVAVDGSDSAFGALEAALALGPALHAPIAAVAAFDPFFHAAAFQNLAGVLSPQASQLFRFREQETLHDEIIDSGLGAVYRSHLVEAQRRSQRHGIRLEVQLLEGKPYDAILAFVEEVRASLLLVGRIGIHHEEGVSLGSTAENLLRLAHCNVLVVARDADGRRPSDRKAAEPGEGPEIRWCEEAEQRLSRAPFFVRRMARKRIEAFAREKGYPEVTLQVYEEARHHFGM